MYLIYIYSYTTALIVIKILAKPIWFSKFEQTKNYDQLVTSESSENMPETSVFS